MSERLHTDDPHAALLDALSRARTLISEHREVEPSYLSIDPRGRVLIHVVRPLDDEDARRVQVDVLAQAVHLNAVVEEDLGHYTAENQLWSISTRIEAECKTCGRPMHS